MEAGRAFPIRTGNSSFQSNVASGHARVHMGDVYSVTHSGAAPPSLRDQILDSLWFDMMEARQDNIKGATPETLDWIYERERSRRDDHFETDSDRENSDSQISSSEDENDQSQHSEDQDDHDLDDDEWDEQDWYYEPSEEHNWDSLVTWLEEDDSIYWVCGKAGSGKSTLMAHIVDDDRTLDCLLEWAKGKPLHILKFFFWRPGSELQKSVTGLLRALLYQICDELEDTIPHVVKASRWNPSRRVPWSDKRLDLAIVAALTSSCDVFCLFLDGLDEFSGDLSILTELVYRLEALENVKLCVSSRPEAELTAKFSACKQLRLEYLNRADIRRFVSSRLHWLSHKPVFKISEGKTYFDFVDAIVDRADGVFLWAILVIPTLVRGITSGDDWDMLHTRLALTPTAIDDLYASMLAKLDPLHRESFYFYVQMMRLNGPDYDFNPSVAQITAAQIGEDLLNTSYDDFLQACDVERLRIIGRSVGLLQISEAPRVHEIVSCVGIPQRTAHIGTASTRVHSAKDAAKFRKPIDFSVLNAEAHFSAGAERLEWIHRSAHDFIFPPDESVSHVGSSECGFADVCQKLLLGHVNLLAVSPSITAKGQFRRLEDSTSWIRLWDVIQLADHITKTGTAIGFKTEGIWLIVRNMHNEELSLSGLPYAREELGSNLNTFSFWNCCVMNRAWSLVQALTPVLLSEPAGNALFMPLWHEMSVHVHDMDISTPKMVRVIMPFLEKVEQNIWLPGKASAQIVLYFEGKRNTKGCTYQRVRHLSCTVPDFLGPRQPAAMQLFFRPYLSAGHMRLSNVLVPYFDRVGASICLFSDIEIQRPKTVDGIQTHRYRVLLQCSYQLKRYLSSGIEDPDRDPNDCYGFRVVCLPAGFRVCGVSGDNEIDSFERPTVEYGERTDFVHFAPSRRTCVSLAQGILQAESHGYGHRDLSDATMLRQWNQMLVEDIWENSHGLEAKQQLFALACVKWTVPRWLGCRMQLLSFDH